MATQQKKRPRLFAERTIPHHPNNMVELVRSLTVQIGVIAQNLTSTPLGYRNTRTRRSLEIAIDQRAYVLAALRAKSPVQHEAICQELNLINNP